MTRLLGLLSLVVVVAAWDSSVNHHWQPSWTNTSGEGWYIFCYGNCTDVTTPTAPVQVIVGGGLDVDDGFKFMIEKSGGGDFVVLRADVDALYNTYIYELGAGHINSVTTVVTQLPAASMVTEVLTTLSNAEAIFLAGGDQEYYYYFWHGTEIETILNAHIQVAPFGGTSAGCAVQGEFVYTAQHSTIISKDALKNPFARQVTLVNDFLNFKWMSNIVLDMHFYQRNRMGRLVTFMARSLTNNWTSNGVVRGVGVSQHSAMLIDDTGYATLAGQGPVFFLESNGLMPEVCEPGTPLTFTNITVYRIDKDNNEEELWMGKHKKGTTGSSTSTTSSSTTTSSGPTSGTSTTNYDYTGYSGVSSSGSSSSPSYNKVWNFATWTGYGGRYYSVSAVNGELVSQGNGGKIY